MDRQQTDRNTPKPTYEQGEAWKGKFLVGLALHQLNDGIHKLGGTEPGDPLTRDEYERLRNVARELDEIYSILVERVKIP